MLYTHFTEKLLGLQGVKVTNVKNGEKIFRFTARGTLKDSETAFYICFPPTQQTSSHLTAVARSTFLLFRFPQRLTERPFIIETEKTLSPYICQNQLSLDFWAFTAYNSNVTNSNIWGICNGQHYSWAFTYVQQNDISIKG